MIKYCDHKDSTSQMNYRLAVVCVFIDNGLHSGIAKIRWKDNKTNQYLSLRAFEWKFVNQVCSFLLFFYFGLLNFTKVKI